MQSRANWIAALLGSVLVAALVAGTAFAQQTLNTVAKLKDLQGNVLVSQGDSMVAGANDQRLAVGTRVVTTGGAKVTINYDVGCDITLKENERFTVRSGECGALLKEVVALGPAEGAIGGGAAGTTTAGAAAAAGGAGAGIGPILIVGVPVGAGIAAYEAWKRSVVSPH